MTRTDGPATKRANGRAAKWTHLSPPRNTRLTARLLTAQGIVILISLAVTLAVAALAGPPLFHDHLGSLPASTGAEQVHHAEQAFRSANLLSMAFALPTAFAAALIVSILAARHIGRPVAAVADAATKVAAGRYEARVPSGGISTEFDRLVSAFNDMAQTLQSTEQTRRRLLGDLGHEMRTPIATLNAVLESIEDGITRFDAQTAALLRAQTQRLARLAEDISAVSRAEEHQLDLHPQIISAEDLVGAAVGTAAASYAAKSVALRTSITGGCPAVSADAARIGQVLGNLLDNALRHTPAGGEVVVTARPAADGLTISITDTGEGIAAEHLPHIFERFYRVDTARDRAHGGSGIGLAIAKALAEAHGGRLTARSPGLGHGATFTLTLPEH